MIKMINQVIHSTHHLSLLTNNLKTSCSKRSESSTSSLPSHQCHKAIALHTMSSHNYINDYFFRYVFVWTWSLALQIEPFSKHNISMYINWTFKYLTNCWCLYMHKYINIHYAFCNPQKELKTNKEHIQDRNKEVSDLH